MISSIDSQFASAMLQAPRSRSSQSLSEEQQQTIKETLANFDADDLSAADARSIVEAFSEAGIQPGAALETAMANSGFDAKMVGDMAGVSQSRPPGPPPGGGGQAGQLNLSDEEMSNLNALLDQYVGGSLDESEKESLLAEIRELLAEGAPEGGLVDLKA